MKDTLYICTLPSLPQAVLGGGSGSAPIPAETSQLSGERLIFPAEQLLQAFLGAGMELLGLPYPREYCLMLAKLLCFSFYVLCFNSLNSNKILFGFDHGNPAPSHE